MSTSSVFRITYHFEKSGKRATETAQANVLAAASDITTIYNVLNGNSLVPSGMSQSNLYIESIGHVGNIAANGVIS